MKKHGIKVLFLGIFTAAFVISGGNFTLKSQAAVDSKKEEKLGTSYQISVKGGKYSSKDSSVAYVDSNGLVTTKKIGQTIIYVKRDGVVYKQQLNVVANGKMKRGVKVSAGEISIADNSVTMEKVTKKLKKADEVVEVPPVPLSMLRTESPVVTTSAPAEERQIAEPSVSIQPVETAQPEISASAQPAGTVLPAEPLKETENKTILKIRVTLKNKGNYAATKVLLYGKVGKKTYKMNFGAIESGESKTVELKKTLKSSSISADITEMKLVKKLVYSNKMYTEYRYSSGKTTFHYGTKDKKAPVISGFIKENSYNQKMPYMVVYQKDEDYDYFQYVGAEDDRDKKVTLTVNTDRVNFKKAGIYKITYTAKDKAGNTAKAWAKIEVRKEKSVDQYASEILSKIIKPKWSVYQKATAIYNYTRHHLSYTGYSNKSSWEKEAINGMRYGRGDCFTYYALARALLTRAGIPNIEVTRYKGAGHHWWNMVYVKGGWYHYDCGPRIGGGRFCLLTDSQLTAYSKTHGNKYIWNYKLIPKSPKKTLTTVF